LVNEERKSVMTNENLDGQLSKLRIDKDRKRVRRRGRLWKWLLFAVVAGAAGYGVYIKMNAPVPVRTAPVDKEVLAEGRGIQMVTASGYVVPRHKIEVSSKIIGRVKEILVKRGDKVNEGDVLLRIEDEEYQAQVRSSEAMMGALRARVDELKAGSRPQEIAASRANVASAQATLRNAEEDFKRAESLMKDGVGSAQDSDQARAARDVARAQLNSAQKNAELVSVGPRREVIDAAEAQLREAEANLEYMKTTLSNTVIKAPITGTILEKLAEQGELVTNTNFGGTRGAKSSVVSMADLSDLLVEVDVNQADLSKVKVGQKSEIRLDSNPDRVYSGLVDDISPQADRQKGTVQTKVRIVDPDDGVRTEVNARVTFLGDAPDAASGAAGKPRLWIPKAAVVQGAEESTVYTVTGDKASVVRVKLGTEAEKGVEVVEGLNGDETLIVSPLDKITAGARVVPVQK
jgi:HlyD family secretion protein